MGSETKADGQQQQYPFPDNHVGQSNNKMKNITCEELDQIQGGVAPILVWVGGVVAGAIIGGMIGNVLNNWGDFKQGIVEGYNTVTKAT